MPVPEYKIGEIVKSLVIYESDRGGRHTVWPAGSFFRIVDCTPVMYSLQSLRYDNDPLYYSLNVSFAHAFWPQPSVGDSVKCKGVTFCAGADRSADTTYILHSYREI